METSQRGHVAVIGAGPAGLSMIKSLMEEGFQVTAFEKRDGPGGIWHFTDDPTITSVTTMTRSQLSKFLTPFSDFPHAEGTSRHPTGKELGDYYQKYADAFGLTEKIKYNVSVESVSRDEIASKWLVSIDGENTARAFDKVVLATGSEHLRKWPKIEDIDAFDGSYIHGQEYKRPELYMGKNVVVVGQGNSAADCAVELSTHAKRVHIAHHRGAMIIPRMVDGARFDRVASWKFTRLGFWLSKYLPSAHRWAFNQAFGAASKSAWGELDPSWKFDPEYTYATNVSTMMLSDGIVPALEAKRVISVPSVTRVTGPKKLELSDGSIVDDVDYIIACTGYETPLHVLGDAITYSQPAPDVRELPHLYHNIFPVDYPDSLACLGYNAFMDNATTCRELAGMAIAQIWAGKSTLPPKAEMKSQVDDYHAWFVRRCRENAPLSQLNGIVEPESWNRFVHDKAGTGLYEHLGWTLTGIKFASLHPWWYLKLAYGVCTPHLYRLFDTGKRKSWPGARDAIIKANKESEQDIKESITARKATKRA